MSGYESRLNWKYASIIMVPVTVIPPYATFLFGIFGPDNHVSISVYALLWVIYPPEAGVNGFQLLNYYALYSGISLGFFNIIFAVQIIRFMRGMSSRKVTLLAGALTLFVPATAILAGWPAMLSAKSFAYVGPVPIQLITGLLLMRFAGPKEVTTPW